MNAKNNYHRFHIRKRPFYVWVLWLLWLLWLFFWGEIALGSWKETEGRAFLISSAVFLVSLSIGFLIWFAGHLKWKKQPPVE